MSLSAHERNLQRACEADIAAGLSAEDVIRYQRMLERGTCPGWFADFLAQGDGRWDIYDGYALLLLSGWWFDGLVAFVHVHVGVGPAADRLVDENNKRLAGLPDWARAEFSPIVGSGYCDDGSFEWTRPLRLYTHGPDGKRASYVSKPWTLPLEVGRTTASRTLLHIAEDNGVARWPYGSNRITVCVATDAGENEIAPLPRLPKLDIKSRVVPLTLHGADLGLTPSRSGAAGGDR